MSELWDGAGFAGDAHRPLRPWPHPPVVEASGGHPVAAGLDAVARAELRRSRQAVFGPDAPGPEMAQFADRIARAVGGREPFVPAPNGPLGSAALRAVQRPPLPAPHKVVAPAPRHDRADNVPLPNAPALVCDSADRIVRVNPALLRLAGRAAEGAAGLFGMRLPQLVVGPEADARLVRPDGGLVRVRVVRWDMPGRELRAVVLVELGVSADDERAAERRRIEELERLAQAGTWTYDLSTGELRRSAALEELYRAVGLAPEALAERAAIESDQVARLCAALRAGAPQRDHTVDLALAGGHRLACRAEVEYGPDGSPARVVGVVRDVGAQRAAEARAKRSGQRFDDLVAVLPGGVAIVDPGGRIVEANESLATLLGAPVEQLRGRPVAALAVDPAGERPAGAFPEWLRLIRPGARYGYGVESVPLRRADGGTAWADLTISVTSTDDGGWFWMVVCTDLAERHRAAAELRRAAQVDSLTGLPTREGVLELLEDLTIGPGRATVAVVCAGVDDFRRVNSSLGHATGDAVLAALARRLREELPEGCTAARLSGDEFVVICPDHRGVGEPRDVARVVADVLSGGMIVDGRPVRLTASAGVAGWVVGRRSTAADLLRFAEVAMHDAKRTGERVAVATETMVASASAALELETDLRAALTNPTATEGLVLHFQPVVGPDGVVASAEALVRWCHPERGMIPPGDFLPVAQRCGLLRDLDLWVLRAATCEAARWPAHDGRVPSVAVNLAGLLPDAPDFVAVVTEIVEASGLSWDRLVLELVESSLVEPSPRARAAMAELTGRGVRFAVDDFGTGWSGLARLRELSAQIVKLDRAFVTGVAADPVDGAVARAVVELARAMGCAVVAEGVETPEQYAALRALGIEAFQGWLFARAMPAAGMRALLVGDRLAIPG